MDWFGFFLTMVTVRGHRWQNGAKMRYFGFAEVNLKLAQARPVRLSDTDLVLSFPRGKNSFTLLSSAEQAGKFAAVKGDWN